MTDVKDYCQIQDDEVIGTAELVQDLLQYNCTQVEFTSLEPTALLLSEESLLSRFFAASEAQALEAGVTIIEQLPANAFLFRKNQVRITGLDLHKVMGLPNGSVVEL